MKYTVFQYQSTEDTPLPIWRDIQEGDITSALATGFAKVAVVEAEDQEDVFVKMNRWSLEDREDIEMTNVRCHSLSVGDCLVDEETGEGWVVKRFGFSVLDEQTVDTLLCDLG